MKFLLNIIIGSLVAFGYLGQALASSFHDRVSEVLLKCEMIHDLCLLKGSYNNLKDLSLILDTGSSSSVIDSSLMPLLKVQPDSSVDTDGPGSGGNSGALVFNEIDIGIGSILLPSQRVLGLSVQYVTQKVGRHVDGFLGANVFEAYQVQINYPRGEVRLIGNKFPTDVHPGEVIDLEIGSDHVPILQADLILKDGSVLRGKFLVDIGQTGSELIITQDFKEHHPELLQEGSLEHSKTSAVGGGFEYDIGPITSLKLRNVELGSAKAVFPSQAVGVYARKDIAGVIGVSALKRFVVTFDYQNRKLVLSK